MNKLIHIAAVAPHWIKAFDSETQMYNEVLRSLFDELNWGDEEIEEYMTSYTYSIAEACHDLLKLHDSRLEGVTVTIGSQPALESKPLEEMIPSSSAVEVLELDSDYTPPEGDYNVLVGGLTQTNDPVLAIRTLVQNIENYAPELTYRVIDPNGTKLLVDMKNKRILYTKDVEDLNTIYQQAQDQEDGDSNESDVSQSGSSDGEST